MNKTVRRQRERELNAVAVKRYRAKKGPEQVREYTRKQVAAWRQRQKQLAVLRAAAASVAGADSLTLEQKLELYKRLSAAADKLLAEVAAEKRV